MPNDQRPEKSMPFVDGALDVFDIFHTIQGEGPHVGRRAIFIRLAGCNLACPFCDTDYTSKRHPMSLRDICYQIDGLRQGRADQYLIVVTGGEPFRQDIAPLAETLLMKGFQVQIETNGTVFPDRRSGGLGFPWKAEIVCSPKSGSIASGFGVFADRIIAFKYVIDADHVSEEDGLPTNVLGGPGRVARPPKGYAGRIYVQPMDAHDPLENQRHLKAAINSVYKFGYTLCLQTHKFIGVE